MDLAAREASLYQWAVPAAVQAGWPGPAAALEVVSGDASFRRYFRLHTQRGPLIAVDAPPGKEDIRPFLAIARALQSGGLRAPQVLGADPQQGFMLLEDFGDRLLLPALDANSVDGLYRLAMAELVRMQDVEMPPGQALPPYDRARLTAEMDLFRDWFLKVHLQLALDPAQLAVLDDAVAAIADACAAQPAVFVHRDYHSRNLMLLADGGLGIIDFQDALSGPVTYDLVSLLRDAYVAWPEARVRQWVREFARLLRDERRLDVDDATFLRWFDWMGAQRHLKVVGIFARLCHRDGKRGYLADMPLVFSYLQAEIAAYPELAPLAALLRDSILPAWQAREPALQLGLPS